ncbi:putative tRNA methyltransferase [Monocercomonoides exilis]|uniref:putative tRNA methyltransferase n=1 Tax=Monocercomonoides exilis TaxID=2049356 RepID=UPI00355A6E58|nr:putative tRNA methyltransferase [Monocercomonoides exilis]|eukprot:MONOS_5499.1-p1 / transcript=MONOS_5499.1 / gene=MONOS_5499 / organism=Monocercomonoides_exilis_PA203 / gene_product=tRNA methyltransferase, putative / transcript_product=tRNA methyltransferase, putative / location=Mono_scaffold00161:44400-48736(-) / protein_length=831 / sequence_SO=supercontig / SO=protein_coding / is_pseudo=false
MTTINKMDTQSQEKNDCSEAMKEQEDMNDEKNLKQELDGNKMKEGEKKRAGAHEFELEIKGVPNYFNELTLTKELQKNGLKNFRRVHKAKGWHFAFVNFEDIETMEAGAEVLRGMKLKGKELDVKRAEPPKHIKEISDAIESKLSNEWERPQKEERSRKQNNDDEDGQGNIIIDNRGKTVVEATAPLFTMEYGKQMMRKGRICRKTLQKIARELKKEKHLEPFIAKGKNVLACPFEGVKSPEKLYGYRNKTKFTISFDSKGYPCVGFMMGAMKDGRIDVEPPAEVPLISSAAKKCAYLVNKHICDINNQKLPEGWAKWVTGENERMITKETEKGSNSLLNLKEKDEVNKCSEQEEQTSKIAMDKEEENENVKKETEANNNEITSTTSASCDPSDQPQSALVPFDRLKGKGFFRGLLVRENQQGDLMVCLEVNENGIDAKVLEEEKKAIRELFLSQSDHFICSSPSSSASTSPSTSASFSSTASSSSSFCESSIQSPLKLRSLIWEVNNRTTSTTGMSERSETLAGDSTIIEMLCGKQFRVSPSSFFQVNTEGAGILYGIVDKWMHLNCKNEKEEAKSSEEQAMEKNEQKTEGLTIADICCGTGSIGLCVCRADEHVVGVDSEAAAIRDAEANAVLNGMGGRCLYVAGKAEDQLKEQLATTKGEVVAVVDPPRGGLHPTVIKTLRSCRRIERVVYVSCNHTTFERDVVRLCKKRYQENKAPSFVLVRCAAVDMFPHTAHVEMVGLLVRGDGPVATEELKMLKQQVQELNNKKDAKDERKEEEEEEEEEEEGAEEEEKMDAENEKEEKEENYIEKEEKQAEIKNNEKSKMEAV